MQHVEQHAGVELDRRIERRAAVIPVEEVGHRDVEGLCNEEKLAYRHPVDTALVFVHLLSADTKLLGHLPLGHAGKQAQFLEPAPEKSIKLKAPEPTHARQSFVVSGV